jgi:hypothetical protein
MLVLESLERSQEGTVAPAKGASQATEFDHSRVVGMRVLRPLPSGGDANLAGDDVVITSGRSGNVRDESGFLLPVLPHPSLLRSDSDVDLHGIGTLKAASHKKRVEAAGRTAEGVTPEAIAAATANVRGIERVVVSSPEDTIAEFGYESIEIASGLLAMQPDSPLVISPTMAAPARAGHFRLHLLSSVPLAVRPIRTPAYSAVINGAWRPKEGTAGGCHLEASWGSNPQYSLHVDGTGRGATPCTLTLVLKRPLDAWMQTMSKHPIESMLGFYVCASSEGTPPTKLPLRKKANAKVVHETCFAPTLEATCTIHLSAGRTTTFVLIPATYGPGQSGPFSIEAASDAPLQWAELT